MNYENTPQQIHLYTLYTFRSWNYAFAIKTYSHKSARTYSNKPRAFILCVKKSRHKRRLIELFTQAHWSHSFSH